MNILVTGGAGYIGSVAVKRLLDKDNFVVVVDNLSKGKRSLVDKRAKFYELDLIDKITLLKVFEENKIDSVIHFAAYKAVEESMQNAVKYSDNLIGSLNLLNCMVKFDVKKIIFSSTAAVYGETNDLLTEESPTNPINFYGFAKLQVEKIIGWYNKIHGINYISLRYFNVAGDDGFKYIDPDAKNVMPIIMEVVFGKRKEFTIFGIDYATADGTCIRDYVDVRDLVDAHILAINSDYNGVINIGTSKGVSVRELLVCVEKITGKEIPQVIGSKREGDPGVVLASNSKAKDILGWSPKYSIKEMVSSTYEAYK